jgi:hypothetical protein
VPLRTRSDIDSIRHGDVGDNRATARPGRRPLFRPSSREVFPDVSLVLIVVGAALVSTALFNKVPRYVPGRLPAPPGSGVATARRTAVPPRVELAPARLTEQGRALLTTVGGSALIVALFLTLSGL